MSTSFVVRKGKIMIGMNYDSGDTIWKLSDLGLGHLTVMVKYFGGWVPAFGVREDGTFINEVRVDPLPEPEQKRSSDTVWTTPNVFGTSGFDDVAVVILPDLPI